MSSNRRARLSDAPDVAWSSFYLDAEDRCGSDKYFGAAARVLFLVKLEGRCSSEEFPEMPM